LPPSPRLSILTAPTAETRVEAAAEALGRGLDAGQVLLVGETREAADDLARTIASRAGATFGLHRFSLRQLAWSIATVDLARRGLAPASSLAAEAVAAHATFEEQKHKALAYLQPIARFRSFGRTLAATLRDLREGDVDIDRARRLDRGGPDIARLAQRYATLLDGAGLVDQAALRRTAAALVRGGAGGAQGVPLDRVLVLLDVAVADEATLDFVRALAGRASETLATVPAGDERTLSALRRLPGAVEVAGRRDAPVEDPLHRVRRFLFAPEDPSPAGEAAESPSLTFFSAPGEGREAVEIARSITEEAARGVALDRMAVLLRSPGVYAGLLQTALDRAGIETWFARGTRVPDPAGRAFLSLLACATEDLSARRFSEYLSLGQVPRLDADGGPPRDRARWVPPDQAPEVGPAPVQASLLDVLAESESDGHASAELRGDGEDEPVLEGTLRAPARWERLLVESAVVGGRHRWESRLNGLAAEMQVRLEEVRAEDPESPRVAGLERDRANLEHLRRFALPVIDRLAAFPTAALWGEWLDHLQELAPMVLANPDRVLAVLGDLRPMEQVGPTPLTDVRDVLHERLTELRADPPARRFGRVFVGTPDQVRGRCFAVVFVPGLAERVFPQKRRQDPLLLDDLRTALNASADTRPRLGLPDRHDLSAQEKLLLRLAVGAATERVHLSYPRLEVGKARPRVPSFYALDIERARTGRVPDYRDVQQRAAGRGDARLAWPAPSDPDRAIDDAEHDLAVLAELFAPDRAQEEIAGRARYLFGLSQGLRRSLVARWTRGNPAWSSHDGLCQLDDATRSMLDGYRLSARPYSPSSLQHFATCPYKFLLASVHRLRPREEVEPPLEKLDPMTRGSLFHQVQADLVRELEGLSALPLTRARIPTAEVVIDEVLDRVAADYEERLAPAITGVWRDEIEGIRIDLKGWLRHVANEDGEWIPMHAEIGFGLPPGDGRDPESVPEPVTVDGRWRLRGVVDLVEARAGPTARGELRVTDHKTGRNRTKEGMVVGGGETLQPVLYGLAVEQTLGRPVHESRLFFCTATGRYEQRTVTLDESARRYGAEVLEIIDRAIETGSLLPAPREGACRWCDFQVVCGPWEEQRTARKDQSRLADLAALRRLP
jgi:CRISPR/Cas system-associated exonuclease Cas4 (RecB family)